MQQTSSVYVLTTKLTKHEHNDAGGSIGHTKL